MSYFKKIETNKELSLKDYLQDLYHVNLLRFIYGKKETEGLSFAYLIDSLYTMVTDNNFYSYQRMWDSFNKIITGNITFSDIQDNHYNLLPMSYLEDVLDIIKFNLINRDTQDNLKVFKENVSNFWSLYKKDEIDNIFINYLKNEFKVCKQDNLPFNKISILHFRGKDELTSIINNFKKQNVLIDPAFDKIIKTSFSVFYRTNFTIVGAYYPSLNYFILNKIIYNNSNPEIYTDKFKMKNHKLNLSMCNDNYNKEIIEINGIKYPKDMIDDMLEISIDTIIQNMDLEMSFINMEP
jgi:hypothetical protein